MDNSKYDTLIFDLDGTLFYTSEDIANSANITLDLFGFDPLDQDRIISHVGGGIYNSISRIIGDAAHANPHYEWEDGFVDQVVKKYRQIYSEHFLETTRPYSGVEKTIENFYQKGYKMAVLSNKAVQYTRAIVEHFQMDTYFELILGGDSLDNKKPHPQSINFILDQYSSSQASTLMVGDTEKDIEAAQNAKVDSCGVSYGMRPASEVKAMDPDYFIDNFSELEEIL